MESLTRSALYEAASRNRDGVGAFAGTYFLTLCPVAAPVAVPEPKLPGLQRFRFFFSRHEESGREGYWLHFGYFRSTDEARKWREVLCRVYPAAAVRSLPQAGRTQSAATSDRPSVLSDTQVLAVLSRKAPESPMGSAAASRQSRQGPTLEDTLSELRDSAWQSLDLNDDTASTTGVRHLRVEVQANRRSRPPKPSRRTRTS